MPEGPIGGPRPGAKSRLRYNVTFKGKTSLSRDPPKAVDVFDKKVNSPQADAFNFITRDIGKVLLAVNSLASPSKYNLRKVDIENQGPGNGLSEDETQWVARYTINGEGMGSFADTLTSSTAMKDVHTVLIEENSGPIDRAQKIREFDSGPFNITHVTVEAV